MLILRPTLSLAKRMKVKLEPSTGVSTTRLGDWYAVDLVLNRRQFVLAVSSESRLGIVISAAPYSTIRSRLPDAVSQVLAAMGVPAEKIAAESERMGEVRLAKTKDRSIIGSMNDYCKHLTYMAQIRRLDLSDLISMSLWISAIPSLVMEPAFPQDAALMLFDQPPAVKLPRIPSRGLYVVK
jgi:hypothetical protein